MEKITIQILMLLILSGIAMATNASYVSFDISDSLIIQNQTLTITQVIDNGTQELDQIWFTLNDTQLNMTDATNGTNIIYWVAINGAGTYNVSGHFNESNGTIFNSTVQTLTIVYSTTTTTTLSIYDQQQNTISKGINNTFILAVVFPIISIFIFIIAAFYSESTIIGGIAAFMGYIVLFIILKILVYFDASMLTALGG